MTESQSLQKWLRKFDASSANETRRLGRELGGLLRAGDVLALTGDLGSGKTTFTKGLAEGIGCSSPDLVSSPTYVLEHIYATPIPLHHYDAYRLNSAAEFLDLGFEERVRLSRSSCRRMGRSRR